MDEGRVIIIKTDPVFSADRVRIRLRHRFQALLNDHTVACVDLMLPLVPEMYIRCTEHSDLSFHNDVPPFLPLPGLIGFMAVTLREIREH